MVVDGMMIIEEEEISDEVERIVMGTVDRNLKLSQELM